MFLDILNFNEFDYLNDFVLFSFFYCKFFSFYFEGEFFNNLGFNVDFVAINMFY